MPTVDTSLADDAIAKIRAEYGEHTIMDGNKMPSVRRLPFEQPGFDYISGGGIPWGRMTRFWGGPKATKSLSIWNLIRNAQNYGEIMHRRLMHQSQIAQMAGDKTLAKQLKNLANEMWKSHRNGQSCLYFNIEKQYDPAYVERLGVDTKRLKVITSTRIEDIGTQARELMPAYHFIAFDSLENAISVEEMSHKDGIYHHPVGVRVFKWAQVLTWLNDRLLEDQMLVYVSQTRAAFGMTGQQKLAQEKAPGGRQIEHNSSMTLHFVRGAWLFRKPDGSLGPEAKQEQGAFGKTQPSGVEIIVKCDKSRVSKGDRTALMHYDTVAQNFDVLHEYDKLARYFGVAKKTSAQSTWYELPDGQKTQSLRKYIADNETFRAAVEDVTLRCAADPRWEWELLRGAS